MTDPTGFQTDSIVRHMSEGVMLIGFDGVIEYFNPAAEEILALDREQTLGRKFAAVFFEKPENDEFSQAVLNAVYDRAKAHDAIVSYTVGEKKLTLRVVTSFYTENKERTGVIIVFRDMSELMELRDAAESLKRIQRLNERLEIRNQLLSTTFGRFLSDEIVKQLLDTPDGLALGGKKQILTIMMSDLRGFTALSEHMDANNLITMLNHYLGSMTEVIQHYNGTIIEFIGDGIMAIFGAPAQSDHHAADAVAAALEMQRMMESVNRWNDEHGYALLEMGIGLHTGEVIVGNIGSEKRTKYGVAGSNVNLCGRIESYTVGGQVLISPETKKSAAVELEIANEMVVYPKGHEGALTISHVTGIGEPYKIYVNTGHTEPKPLKKTVPVSFHKIEGKHGQVKNYYGGIIAVANDRALFETESPIKIYDNLLLEAGGELYCKVMEETDEGYLLQYTSVPAGYASWIKPFQ